MNALKTTGKSKPIIALVVPNINHSFFSTIADQLTSLAFSKGYLVSVFQSNEDYQQEFEIIDTIISRKFAAVLVSISKNTIKCDHFRQLQEAGIPLVFFDRVCDEIVAPKVLIDNYEITCSITEELIKKGNRRIALIVGSNDINVFRERQQGYLDTLDKHGLSYRMPVVEDEFSIEKGKDIFIKLWSSAERPDAIISSSIQLTLGILLQTKLYKIKIPDKLDLISYVSHISFKIIQPQVTIIDQPENEIAEFSFDFLEKMILKKPIPENEMIKTVNAKIALKKI